MFQEIGATNNLIVLGSKKTKEHKQDN